MRTLRAHWSVLRARFPGAAARMASVSLGARGYLRLVAEVHTLRTRTHELERDHALLAAHVATLSERAFGGRGTADSDALDRARLSVIASYEHRIATLEDQAGRTRRARIDRTTASDSKTFDERQRSSR